MAFSNHDIVSDSPTNNFATLNPLGWKDLGGANSAQILSEGNLKTVASGTAGSGELPSIIPSKTGINKVYFEARGVGSTSATNGYIAIFEENGANLNPTNVHRQVGQNEIVSWVIDVSEGKLWRQSNGNWSAARKIEIENGQNPDLTFNCSTNILEIWFATYTTDRGIVLNFGQDQSFAGTASGGAGATDSEGYGQFYYEPPTGALALCTANLPEMTPDVTGDTPQDYFKTVLYTGNGSTQSITGVGFAADMVWAKARSAAYNHWIYDVIRGGNKGVLPNLTNSENTNTAVLTSLDADGFTLGNNPELNDSGVTYVAWCWKAGGAAVTNNDGSITSTVSANTDAGFSIVSWTGTGSVATVGHGLSSAPDMVIVKGRSYAQNWLVYHSGLGATKWLQLNSSVAAITETAIWNNTAPTSSTFTVGTSAALNPSGGTNISYCWHSVEGYSKFGSYTGNGSTDGPFVYCGFRPAFVMIKSATQGLSYHNWYVHDSTRGPYNGNLPGLSANLPNQEFSFSGADFLSNGFKIRANGGEYNQSGETYIFMSFAEQPFIYSNAR
jgi:hypothetical protein